MTLQVDHPVADWYLQFDDLWELMRVNWQTHNTFTQAGMWQAGECVVLGLPMVIDTPPYRGVLLQITDGDGEGDFIVITTYGPKCGECGYQPYDKLLYGSADMPGVLEWAAQAITAMFDNARDNGIERAHLDECSHLTYDDDEGEHDDG
jgi:hypothetical protein